jgi:hypothetical protein
MPLWGNTDTTGNSAIFAPAQVKVAPNTANRDDLYGNTTANAWFGSGETIGMFGVGVIEKQVQRLDGVPRAASPGWQLRTTGAGGRAGRVSYETLVAMRSLATTGDSDTVPDYHLAYTTQPEDSDGYATNDQIITLAAEVASTPDGASITYQWQYWDGDSWAAIESPGTGYESLSWQTANLEIQANSLANGVIHRLNAVAAGATNAYSANAVGTILPLIEILADPENGTGNADADEIVTFLVAANAENAPLSYQWQKWDTDAFANLAEAGAYSNVDIAELSVLANTAANGEIYRCWVGLDNSATFVYSANATLTVTTA